DAGKLGAREWKQKAEAIEQKDLVGGVYTLSLEDGNDESLMRHFKLDVPDALTITLGSDREFSQTEPIVLDVSSQVPDSIKVSYRWENSFGFSSSDRSIKVIEPAVYRVFVTKEKDGCVFTDDVAVTGAEKQTIAVYPTILRSNEDYNVSVSMQEVGAVTVKVYNAKGIVMDEMAGADNSEYQFITRIKDSGIYLVVVQTPKGMETHKIIVH
ncbi:MAG TPA: T9SS type A sorting domain-containing protein, partial [Chryseosolibacter sp.]|nr:T9SS type A sorting domain-containing protein [Chryseosolibacter sp.]